MSKKITVTVFLCLVPVLCIAGVWQNYDNLYTAPMGPFGSVKLINHDGYIWSVSGSGIWRFDPKTDEQTIIYPADWMESGGRIVNHYISTNGDFWLVLITGIARWDGINWHFFDSGDIPDTINSLCIAEDSSGTIWFTSSHGLVCFNGSNWKYLDKINDISIAKKPNLICSDNEGNLWLAYLDTPDNEFLAKKTGDNWTIFQMPAEYNFASYQCKIYADNAGGIWFTGFDSETKNKIFRFYDGVFTPLQNGNIASFALGNDGSIWIQYGDFYVHHVLGDEWTTYEPRALFPEITYPKVGEITTLPDGSLWILMYDAEFYLPVGFAVIEDGELSRRDISFSGFPSSQNYISFHGKHGALLSNTYLLEMKDINNPYDFTHIEFDIGSYHNEDVFIDSLDRIWLAGRNTFISFKDGVPTYHHKESWWFQNAEARALSEGPNGTIWLAMKEQLYSCKDDLWAQASISTYNLPYNITVDTAGTVWLACGNKGLFKYDGQDSVKVVLPDNDAYVVNNVSPDSKGGVWVATSPVFANLNDGGLYYINADNITKYAEEEGLPGKYIQYVEAAPDDSVWFNWRDIIRAEPYNRLTTGGVCHFDGTNIEIYRPKEGLASLIINDIAVSDSGILWFATDAGLSTLDLNATPDPKIRTGVNKHNLKAVDEFKLGVNLQNRGPQRTVKLVTALLYNGTILYFDFASGQFTANFTAFPLTIPEDFKFNTEIWKLEVPASLEGTEIIFGSALLDGSSSEIIEDVSIEKINFVE